MFDARERLVHDGIGGVPQSALSEIISKSADAFPRTSSAALFRASSFSSRSTCRRSFSFSTSAADYFGRAGLVRRSTRFSNAPASRAARHSVTWEWYRRSRRRTAPFSPSGAASYSATIRSLYSGLNVLRFGRGDG
ncbi:hypothetical protein ACFV1W_29485 [Kitasatospora sp. NPDC059648]|uniref:hypothetical protein n=1 Tax=Kitasatospora sp. NPDC059648 TaxID=3346894 RepID=UPI0036902058